MKASELFEFPDGLPFAEHFSPEALPWEWISAIKRALAGFADWNQSERTENGVSITGHVYIHPSVALPAFCSITGPAWIGEGVEIRPGAYVRGNVIVGSGCVLGNSCEYKNCLLLENVQTPHFSYIGDSVLGNGSHLGAGVILSNLRLDQAEVSVMIEGERFETGLRKFGALLGDGAEVGCNAVLNPGSVIGKRSLVGPLTSFSGYLAQETICIDRSDLRRIPRRD